MGKCVLCNKKAFFDCYYVLPESLLVCGECNGYLKKTVESTRNEESYSKALKEFTEKFEDNVNLDLFVNYFEELNNQTEKKKVEKTQIIEKNQNDDCTDSFAKCDVSFENGDMAPVKHNSNADKGGLMSDSIGMFDNIAGKIKTLAKVVTWMGISCSVIFGMILMSTDESLVLLGLLIMILGSLCSWVSAFILYGFGQLIENTDKLIELSKNKTDEK